MRRSEELTVALGKRLEDAREEAGITRPQMEQILKQRDLIKGKSKSSNLSRWENGTSMPDLDVISTYAEVTGKTIEWFVGAKTAEDIAAAGTAATIRMFTTIIEGQPPDEAYQKEFGAEGAMHPLMLGLIHAAGDNARSAFAQWLQANRGLTWSELPQRERDQIVAEFVRHVLGRADQGRAGGASDGQGHAPPGKTESASM